MTPLLTAGERAALDLLGGTWNAFSDLEQLHACELDEFCRAIHAAQQIIMARPVQRQLNAERPATAPDRPALRKDGK